MTTAHHRNTFEVLTLAIQAAETAIDIVDSVPAKYRSLQDQVIRSASSVPANLAEGQGRNGKDRFYHYRIAYGSANEVAIHLRLLMTAGSIDRGRSGETFALFDRVRAMIWRLLHPKR